MLTLLVNTLFNAVFKVKDVLPLYDLDLPTAAARRYPGL